MKILDKNVKKKKWIKVLGFWIKDNGMLELSKHVDKRRGNSIKEERNVQHWTLNCLTKDIKTRRTVFIMRFVQKF